MANSLVLDWLDENKFRAYPLKSMIVRTSGGYTLTDDIILDAQFIYSSLPTDVQLLNITSDSTNVTFTCTGSVVFVVPKASTFPLSVRLSSGNLLTVGAATADIPNGSYNFTQVIFEPSVSHEFSGAWLGVTSLTFGSSGTLTGNINFIEGYQFGIAITNPLISLSCGNNFGIPVACNTFAGYTPDCADIISYINGVSPDGKGVIHFTNGGEMLILDDPDNHRIFIGLLPNAGDICRDILANPSQLTL